MKSLEEKRKARNAKAKRWREANPEAYRAINRRHSRKHRAENPGENYERVKRWNQAHPELAASRRKIHNKVHRAVKKGKLEKEPCIFCGTKKVEAHHHDYSKPLEVTWVCKRHHALIHRTSM
jgi:hypothetical protein